MSVSGGTLNFAWSGLPTAKARSTVRIWVNYEGDIYQARECAEVVSEGGRGFSGFCSYGSAGSTTVNYAFSSYASADEFNSWNSDGAVRMSIKLGAAVNTGIGVNQGTMQMQYCI